MGRVLIGLVKWVVIIGLIWITGDRYGAPSIITDTAGKGYAFLEEQACGMSDAICFSAKEPEVVEVTVEKIVEKEVIVEAECAAAPSEEEVAEEGSETQE